MASDIEIPFASATMEEGTLIEWTKADGEAVAAGDVICLCDTDKATIEIEAPEAGTLRIVVAASEDPLAVGTVVGRVE
jgi:pyruvate dehydrogenase E2 component (dihydrolipoamide acetyltransferase)